MNNRPKEMTNQIFLYSFLVLVAGCKGNLPNNIDLKLEVLECFINDGKIMYKIKVSNSGLECAPNNGFQVYAYIDGEEKIIDLTPGKLKSNGSTITYGGSFKINSLEKKHNAVFLINAKDGNNINNRVELELK